MGRGGIAAVVLVAGLLLMPAAWAQVQPQGPQSVAALAEKLSPAVVNIGTTRRVPGGGGAQFPEFPDGSPLAELFEQLNPNAG